MLLNHYRKNLRAIVGAAAAPYGYTLSIWAAGAALISVHGIPKTLAALSFVVGWTKRGATPSCGEASNSSPWGSRSER